MELRPLTFDFLASSLDEACEGGHLPNPNLKIASVEDTNRANTKSYILAIRSRLIDLGYLGESTENRSNNFLDSRLKKAIKNFQKEAGLTSDAWVGPKTWTALQQLVSFEDEQNPANWRKELLKDLSQPAILRAVYLRLYALGFFKWNQRLNVRTNLSLRSNFDFKSAFREFLKAAHAIGILERKLAPIISIKTLSALFQQDEMIHALNRNPDFVKDSKNKRFVEALARIELWMLGFNVSVGNPKFRFRKRKGRLFKERVTRLTFALSDFWEQQPDGLKPATKKARETVTPEFFKQLVVFEEEDRTPDDAVEEDLIKRISTFSEKEQEQLKSRLKNIAGSIWDGVKRVFRWIKRFIKSIVVTTLNTIKNIARFIAKHARSIFGTIRKVFEILYWGTVYLRNKVLPGSDARHLALYHDKDFDVGVFLNSTAKLQTMQRLIDYNLRESVCFGAACRILGHIIAILRRVVRAFVTGIGGWFLALITLSRLAMRVKDIVAEVKLVEAFEIESDSSPFVNSVD